MLVFFLLTRGVPSEACSCAVVVEGGFFGKSAVEGNLYVVATPV